MHRFLWGMFLLTNIAGAAPIPASGVDLDTSTIQVSFSNGNSNGPIFSCFGQTGTSTSGSTTAVVLSSANFVAGTPFPGSFNNCFQQAGEYIVTLSLHDLAGNISTDQVLNFAILPASPDTTNSTFTIAGACNDSSLKANDSDTCDANLTSIDAFGNPVVQFISLGTIRGKVWATDPIFSDANTGMDFRTGLRMRNGLDTIPTATPGLFNFAWLGTPTPGTKVFDFSAIAPSIESVGSLLAKVVSRSLDFSFQVPTINTNGTVNTSTLISLSSLTIGMTFTPLIELVPSVAGIFLWGHPHDVTVTPGGTPGDISITASSRSGILTGLPGTYNFHDGTLPDNFSDLNTVPTAIQTLSTTIGDEESPPESIDGLGFSTAVTYQVGGISVGYPAGGVGITASMNAGEDPLSHTNVVGWNGDDVGLRVVGTDIEGTVLGNLDEILLDPSNTDYFQGIHLSTLNQQDIRESITENAFRLMRGAAEETTGNTTFASLNFGTNNIVLVNGDVRITSATVLPSGKNTLVIHNGDLIVESGANLSYASNNDSFGFILVNDTPATPNPAGGNSALTGNIFVHSSVQKLVGAFYADGTFATNDSSSASNIDNIDNSATLNRKQLVLEGTLFSRNTIGGSILQVSNQYVTPWGYTASNASTDRDWARKFDLHFIRRYATELVDLGDCYNNGGGCDSNENAFVIRIDRRVTQTPPPGFENTAIIKR
jgi:hypothetical protein